MKIVFFLIFVCLTIGQQNALSQILQEKQENLQKLSVELKQEFESKKNEAIQKALNSGIPVRQEFDDGTVIELMRFQNGRPVYASTQNSGGAELINTDKLYNGGGAGLHLSGTGQLFGLWDAGHVRGTHNELSGRVTYGEDGISSGDNSHATRVAGTLISEGIDPDLKGMAYSGSLVSYEWNDDQSEMASEASGGLLISVNPYTYFTGWEFIENNWYWYGSASWEKDYQFGYYDEIYAKVWDEIAFNAPNFLIVAPSGNMKGIGPVTDLESEDFPEHFVWDGNQFVEVCTDNDDPNGPDCIPKEINGGDTGYNSISFNSVAKNIITVGSVDASKNLQPDGGWGPTDDGRIKPDVVAKGVSVKSTNSGGDSNFSTSSGTSFSTPMVAGSTGLLLEHQKNLHDDRKLLSSTLKALIIHSADDMVSGAAGPDYRYGWGLMNTEAAAAIMSKNSASNQIHIHESTLPENETITFRIKADGNEPLRTTIAWTDPSGTPIENPENSGLSDRALVNDLDLYLIDSNLNQFYPYILDPSNPSTSATTGDNDRDNIEMVYIENPTENEIYTVQISHKGSTLEGGSQNFSLIITGNIEETFTQQIDEGNGEGWRFFSSPGSATYGELLEDLWIQGPANSNYETQNPSLSNIMLYGYDGENYNYISVEDMNNPIPPGVGLAVFVYPDDNFDNTDDPWPKNISISGMEHPAPVVLSTDNVLNQGNDIFSLLGNPYNSAIDFDKFDKTDIGNVVYVYDHACDSISSPDESGGVEGGCFRAWNGSAGSLADGLIAPFQGFFVFATGGSAELTIPYSARDTGASPPFYKEKTPSPVVQLAARINGKQTADTWFSFTETGNLERNNYDAPMLYPIDYRPFLALYSEIDDDVFNIKNLPVDFDNPLRIPIGLQAWNTDANENNPGYLPMDGTVELIWPKMKNIPPNWTISLTDNHNGNVVNLREQDSYTFLMNTPANKMTSDPYEMNIKQMKSAENDGTRFTLIIQPFVTGDPFADELPREITLRQNYPNPFNPSTLINYELPENSEVLLDVYSIEGQKVATLVNGSQQAGMHSVMFNASNLASGVYLYRLSTGRFLQTKKMILIK